MVPLVSQCICSLSVACRSITRDPTMYPNPEKFDPERYLKDGKPNPDVTDPTTIAFGFGRRSARYLFFVI